MIGDFNFSSSWDVCCKLTYQKHCISHDRTMWGTMVESRLRRTLSIKPDVSRRFVRERWLPPERERHSTVFWKVFCHMLRTVKLVYKCAEKFCLQTEIVVLESRKLFLCCWPFLVLLTVLTTIVKNPWQRFLKGIIRYSYHVHLVLSSLCWRIKRIKRVKRLGKAAARHTLTPSILRD